MGPMDADRPDADRPDADLPDADLVALPPLDEHGRAEFVHDGAGYAVFTVDGDVVVTDGTCPHRGGPVGRGVVRDGAVVCPWHWYTFDLRTGACLTASETSLRRHPVERVDGVLHARVTRPARRSWAELLRAHAAGEDAG